mmetsp:Transcript_31658/g.99294  ORF Transcript_31658/g.99294 Transcript_31658/m.99294 type:complete len:356 (-) Transcript_31658:214-1281(-)
MLAQQGVGQALQPRELHRDRVASRELDLWRDCADDVEAALRVRAAVAEDGADLLREDWQERVQHRFGRRLWHEGRHDVEVADLKVASAPPHRGRRERVHVVVKHHVSAQRELCAAVVVRHLHPAQRRLAQRPPPLDPHVDVRERNLSAVRGPPRQPLGERVLPLPPLVVVVAHAVRDSDRRDVDQRQVAQRDHCAGAERAAVHLDLSPLEAEPLQHRHVVVRERHRQRVLAAHPPELGRHPLGKLRRHRVGKPVLLARRPELERLCPWRRLFERHRHGLLLIAPRPACSAEQAQRALGLRLHRLRLRHHARLCRLHVRLDRLHVRLRHSLGVVVPHRHLRTEDRSRRHHHLGSAD